MSLQELKRAYEELPQEQRLLFAAMIAAEQLAHDEDFAASLGRRHQAMDAGRKWSHADVSKLHEELEKQGL